MQRHAALHNKTSGGVQKPLDIQMLMPHALQHEASRNDSFECNVTLPQAAKPRTLTLRTS